MRKLNLIRAPMSLRLQEALVNDVTRILNEEIKVKEEDGSVSTLVFKKPKNQNTTKVNVYRNRLPILKDEDDEDDKFFPYCIVRLDSSVTEEDGDYDHVSVGFYFGAYDNDRDGGGDIYIQAMIDAVKTRFEEEPLLDHMFRAEPDTDWALQDADSYPYYFGALEITFGIPKMKRKDLFTDGRFY